MFKIAPPWSLHRGAFSCPLMMGYGSRGTCSGGKAGSPPRPPERGARPPRRGAEAEAGRAGRRAAARQAGRGGARRQTGSAAAKIFGDIRGVRGRKNIRGHLGSGKPPEKARVGKRPCVFRDRGSPRWRAGRRGGAATPDRPDRPRGEAAAAGFRLRGLASADCASRFGGRLGARGLPPFASLSPAKKRAPPAAPRSAMRHLPAPAPFAQSPLQQPPRRGGAFGRRCLFPPRRPAHHRGDGIVLKKSRISKKTKKCLDFLRRAFSGGFPLPRWKPRIFLRPRTPRMEAPNIFAAALPVCLRAPPLPACLAAAHLPALPRLCLGSPSRRAGTLSSPSRGGLPALPPLQVPREPTPRPRPPGGHLTIPAAWVAASPVGSYMPPVGRRLPPRGCANGPPTPPPRWGGSPFKIEDKQVAPGCAQR